MAVSDDVFVDSERQIKFSTSELCVIPKTCFLLFYLLFSHMQKDLIPKPLSFVERYKNSMREKTGGKQ